MTEWMNLGNWSDRPMRSIRKGLEAARLRSALDGCDTMVMVSNRRGQIIYQNDTLKSYLRGKSGKRL